MASATPAARRRRAVETFGAAAEAVGPVARGMAVFGVSRGQFAMIDLIQHCLAQIGPADVSLWTWVIADYEVDAVNGLLANGAVRAATLILDYSASRRRPAVADSWRDRFGEASVKVVRNHAKIARVWNADFQLLLRGSMNLNYNPRFEQFDVTEGGPDFDLVAQIEAEIPALPRAHNHRQVAAATRLGQAFDAATLALFGGAGGVPGVADIDVPLLTD